MCHTLRNHTVRTWCAQSWAGSRSCGWAARRRGLSSHRRPGSPPLPLSVPPAGPRGRRPWTGTVPLVVSAQHLRRDPWSRRLFRAPTPSSRCPRSWVPSSLLSLDSTFFLLVSHSPGSPLASACLDPTLSLSPCLGALETVCRPCPYAHRTPQQVPRSSGAGAGGRGTALPRGPS